MSSSKMRDDKNKFGMGDVREMPGAENLAALDATLKHEEGVQRHIEQGNMAPHEEMLYVLQNGSTSQKINILQRLSRIIKEGDDRKAAQLVTALSEGIWAEDVEFQCAVPQALVTALPLLSESNLLLLLGGVKTMLEVRNPDIRKAWNVVVLETTAVLPSGTTLREVVPFALGKVEHGSPSDQRMLGCQLFGRMARRLPADTISSTFLSKAMSLCQDTDVQIRVGMCAQLGEVARGVGLETTKARITAELFDLLVDEEKLVSRAAFTCLIDLVEFFDAPYRREHFYPIIRSYISSPPEEVLSLLIEEFGRFLWKIKSDIQGAEDITLFANFFRQCAQKPDPEVRRMCAFNLPAVVASLPITTYATHLTHVTKALAVDPHPPVRRAIAAGLHELFGLLGDKASFYLEDSFMALIKDSMLEVRTHIVSHLSAMLTVFSAHLKGDEREHFFTALTPSIVGYEALVAKDWRRVQVLFSSFAGFPSYFPPQLLCDKFLPLLVRHLQRGAAALKEHCAELIVHFCARLQPAHNQLVVELFSKTINEQFGRSGSCHCRLAFITLFRNCARHYSRRFMRDRLLETVLSLADDHVVALRVALVQLLPDLKKILKPPTDDESAKLFAKALAKLHADHSPEVAEALRAVTPAVDEVEAEFARQAALRITNSADDVADRAREDSEGNLVDLARELEKSERRQKIREMLRNERESLALEASIGRPGPGGRGGAGVGGAGVKARPHGSLGGGVGSGSGPGAVFASRAASTNVTSPLSSVPMRPGAVASKTVAAKVSTRR